MSTHSCQFPELHLSDFLLCYFDFLTRKWISLALACGERLYLRWPQKSFKYSIQRQANAVWEVTKRRKKRERRDEIRLWWAVQPGQSLGREPALVKQQQLWVSVSLECTSVQPSLHLVKGLAFDDSAACRLPGEIWPTVWKTLSAPDHTCFYSLPVVRGPFWNGTPQEIRPKLWGV